MLNLNFEDVPESGAALDPGEYTVVVSSAEVCTTKKGDGQYLKIEMKTDSGRKLFHNFNFENPNPEAKKIGLGQLKTMQRVAGYPKPGTLGEAEELLGLRFNVIIKTKEGTGGYGPSSVVTSFKPASE